MSADQLLSLLHTKHASDVFIPECKDGPTHYANYLRLDAWVMTRSWANPLSIVYEIKCGRNDFLNDTKWRKYLPYCNEFYFVTPKGLIQPNELPTEVGLLEATVNLKRLICRKKAVYRNLVVPERLYRYILMCRTRVVSEDNPDMTREERLEKWKSRLEGEFKTTGLRISKRVVEEMDRLREENVHLKSKYVDYDDIRAFLTHLGIPPDHHISRWTVERAIQGDEKNRFVNDLNAVIDRSQSIIDSLKHC